MSLNKIQILGTVGFDPVLHQTMGGKDVCVMWVSTHERWVDRSGTRQERTEWHKVVTFGPTARRCARLATRGRRVFVDGSLRSRHWEDQDGHLNYRFQIFARLVRILDAEEQAAAE